MTNKSDREKNLSRIRKCLALAKSSEPHEAAAALRQAQKLMVAHGIDMLDVELASVGEARAPAGRAARRPPRWLAGLGEIIGKAFGVEVLYETARGRASRFCFVGVSPASDVAAYAFTVLRRQCESARAAHYAMLRGPRSGRVRRADVYALGWVKAVYRTVMDFAQTVPQIVAQHLERQELMLKKLAPISRGTEQDRDHESAGYADGRHVYLHHGVGAAELKRIPSNQRGTT